MKQLEEKDIRRLLETSPAASPPEDLADLLKAQIPDPLPQWDEDEAVAPSPDPSPQLLPGPWSPKRWRTVGRLAAALVAMVGVGALSLQLLQWSTSSLESPAAFDVASQAREGASSSEATRGVDSMSDDVLSKSGPARPVPEAESPDVLSLDTAAIETPVSEAPAAETPVTDPTTFAVPEAIRSVPEPSTSATAEISTLTETPDTLPPPRAKRVMAPTASEESQAPAVPSAPAQTVIPSETAASAETARRLEVPVDVERRKVTMDDVAMDTEAARTPRREPSLRDRAAAPLETPTARTRREQRSPESADQQRVLEMEAKSLEGVGASTIPWTVTEATPRLEWRPSAVDVSTLDAWRRDLEMAGSPLDAALLNFGALSGRADASNRLWLDLAPSPRGGLDGAFWLLVETASMDLDGRVAASPKSSGLDLEFSPRAVARYHVLAEGFDEETGTGRLLVAMQLTSSPSISADDFLLKVQQARRLVGQGSGAAVQETVLRRRDVVPDWHGATWPYRVQTLGVGLVQAVESASGGTESLALTELRRKAQDLRDELPQRLTTETRKAQLNAWLEWLVGATETKD